MRGEKRDFREDGAAPRYDVLRQGGVQGQGAL